MRGPANVFALTYTSNKVLANAYSLDGSQVYEMTVSREGSQEAGSETAQDAVIGDVDTDGQADILLATEIKAAYVQTHRLYRIQRIPEEGLGRLYNRFVWMDKASGRVTSISLMDVDSNRQQEIITSSLDDLIRVYSAGGTLLANVTLNMSLTHVTPFFWSIPSADAPESSQGAAADSEFGQVGQSQDSAGGESESDPSDSSNPPMRKNAPESVQTNGNPTETAATGRLMQRKLMFLAAGHQGISLVEKNNGVVWQSAAGSRFDKTAVLNTNSRWPAEFLGLSNETLHAYDRRGNLVWTYFATHATDMDSVVFPNSPERFIVLGAEHRILLLDGNGTSVYEQPVDDQVQSVKTISLKDKSLILVGTRSGLISFKVNDVFFKTNEAYGLLKRARLAYAASDFNQSAALSRSAAKIFRQVSLLENQSEAQDLEGSAMKLQQANELYLKAKGSYGQGKFNDSVKYAMMAQAIYEQAGFREGVNRSVELGDLGQAKAVKMITQVADRKQADELYSKAEAYYINSTYAQSLLYAQKAYSSYVSLDDADGIRISQKLIEMNQKNIVTTTTSLVHATTSTLAAPRPAGLDVGENVPVGVGALALAVIIFLFIRRRKK
jgi:tetratricopeptide (TPR) repeat protein